MPLSENLLTPFPGAQASGENIRYAPVFDKIKEARRKEEVIAQGDWQRQLKEADYRLVIKLATETLSTKSKDLQVAAWLTEALTYEQGIPGLCDGLNLLHSLIDKFWESVYPEAEDGDLELRVAPLNWVGDYKDLERAVRSVPLTKEGLDWFKYKESRTVGYEADCGDSTQKIEARRQAISERKLTAEEFDQDFASTSKAYYQKLMADTEKALEALQTLDEICEKNFGDAAPSYRTLRSALEDVEHTARMLLVKKRETEPDAESEAVPDEGADDTAVLDTAEEGSSSAAIPAAVSRVAARKAGSVEPADRDDAIRRVVAAALYLRAAAPNDPVPYMLLRSVRWGELRAQGDSLPPDLLAPPPTEMRQQLKRAAMDGDWTQVLETAETAMGMPCGRGWLDLQRYAVRACLELGHSSAAAAISSELKTLLAQFPALAEMTLLDDTPTANSETQTWLKELLPVAPVAEPERPQPAPVVEIPEEESADAPVLDAYQLAQNALRSRDPEQALSILTREIARERSGRGRFLRRFQLAQICLGCGRDLIAQVILEELSKDIELRGLDDWELPETIAQVLALLFRCLEKGEGNDAEKKRIYALICRLDPVQAARLSA